VPLAKRPQGARLLAALRPGDVIVWSRMDRCFRSAFDALATIEGFKKRKISLWLLDLGGDVSGNGISQMKPNLPRADWERGSQHHALIVDECAAAGATFEQVKAIFAASGFAVLKLSELS
jgi:hypothetical protein